MDRGEEKTATDPEVKIHRVKSLVRLLGISRTTIWRLVKGGDFPKPISLGKRAKGWRREDIDEWVRSREAA